MRRSLPIGAFAAGAAILAAGALQAYVKSKGRKVRPAPGSAPVRTGRTWFGDYAVAGRTVTINRPRAELFAWWRDFRNLPTFMENVERVRETNSGAWEWIIAAPAGLRVRVETRIVEERENELIAWRSTPDSQIDTEGRIAFRDAPGGRGTEVEAIVAYKPPAGELGRQIAKLFGREPSVQGRRELRRFKMLMETGEIATSRNRRAQTAPSEAAPAARQRQIAQ